MGTGKTTVGRILAGRLGMDFVDMDVVIEERAGKSISRIFDEDGEAAFRAMERNLVRELSGRRGLVVAAGGGVVLNNDNLKDFAESGTLVCLDADADTILRRVADERHRPLLEDGEKEARIRDLLSKRRPFYAGVRHHVNTVGLSPEEVADRVEAILVAAAGGERHSSGGDGSYRKK